LTPQREKTKKQIWFWNIFISSLLLVGVFASVRAETEIFAVHFHPVQHTTLPSIHQWITWTQTYFYFIRCDIQRFKVSEDF
jgi:hypothetical protein